MVKKVKKGGEKEKKKNSKDKGKTKKIKRVKEDKKEYSEKNLEEEIIEIKEKQKKGVLETYEEPITNLEISLTETKAPVLERVAIAKQTPITRTITPQNVDTERDSQREVNYDSTSSAYLTTAPEKREENNSQYEGTSVNYSSMDQENEETRRLLTGGDMSQLRRTNDSIEKQAFVKQEKETRKYISEGDHQ